MPLGLSIAEIWHKYRCQQLKQTKQQITEDSYYILATQGKLCAQRCMLFLRPYHFHILFGIHNGTGDEKATTAARRRRWRRLKRRSEYKMCCAPQKHFFCYVDLLICSLISDLCVEVPFSSKRGLNNFADF